MKFSNSLVALIFLSFSVLSESSLEIKEQAEQIMRENIVNGFNEAKLKYPENKSLFSFENYYNQHKNIDGAIYLTGMYLQRMNSGQVDLKDIKKLTIGEVCGIMASVRMYSFYSVSTSGVESSLYSGKAVSNGEKILLNYRELDFIKDTFRHLKESPQYLMNNSIDETAEMVLRNSLLNCEKRPSCQYSFNRKPGCKRCS